MLGAILPLSQYAFMAWCLVKHRDNFTFTFCLATLVASADDIAGWWPERTFYSAFNLLLARQTDHFLMLTHTVVIPAFHLR
jgi:hypothetical protein